MVKTEKLPRYVSSFVDNRGTRRYRFRKVKCAGGYFEAHPNTAQGREEYARFLATGEGAAKPRKTAPRSIDALIALYYTSTAFRGNAAEVSLAKRRAVIEAFRAEHGARSVKGANFAPLDRYIAKVAKGWADDRGRPHGGAFAAETARKQISAMFKYAVKLEWRSDNPMQHVNYRPKKTEGFHSWTEAEIAQYRAKWALGTKQRLALELMLWTGKRRSDAVRIGPQHVAGDELAGRDQKTGKRWTLPIARQLRQAIDAMPDTPHLCYLMSERGRAYSAASFGNVFRDWCDAAGLPQCSAHGLRKAIMRRGADGGISQAGLKSISLHTGDQEVAIYIAAADQKRLSRDAIDRISRAEVSSADCLATKATK